MLTKAYFLDTQSGVPLSIWDFKSKFTSWLPTGYLRNLV